MRRGALATIVLIVIAISDAQGLFAQIGRYPLSRMTQPQPAESQPVIPLAIAKPVRLPPVCPVHPAANSESPLYKLAELQPVRLPQVIESQPATVPQNQPAGTPVPMPQGFVPWWQSPAMQPLRESRTKINVDVNSLVLDALRHSAQVKAISDNALIAETSITRAAAEFDITTFMESKLVRVSNPTGSTLEAGFNVPRLREQDWFYSAGLKKKSARGGNFEITQQIGTKNSNSEFFFPDHQANSRLTLGYKQPLLNGAGKVYNNSLIVLAEIETRTASNQTQIALQDHLLSVTEAMWEIYLQRTLLLQKQRHLDRAQVILTRLEQRRGLDALQSQVVRARAAVSGRRVELIRANTAIRNAEARVRALVNSPDMLANRQSELVPIEPPTSQQIFINLEDAVVTALEHRPEITIAAQEIKAAGVRLNVAQNELLPVLDVVLETYVSGLRGDYQLGNSLSDQFNVGEPSYTAGLLFEVPLNRRAAKASVQRRQIELRQLSNRLTAAIETLHADVEVAVREVETTRREMQAKYVSMTAAQADVQYLQRRWEELPGDDRSASFLLADLLDAQDRLVFEENGFARAQVNYALSLTRVNRATGTLLIREQIQLVRGNDHGTPAFHFEKGDQWQAPGGSP